MRRISRPRRSPQILGQPPARFVGPNPMAGNVLMVKHIRSVPRYALAFVALFKKAGGRGPSTPPHGHRQAQSGWRLYTAVDPLTACCRERTGPLIATFASDNRHRCQHFHSPATSLLAVVAASMPVLKSSDGGPHIVK